MTTIPWARAWYAAAIICGLLVACATRSDSAPPPAPSGSESGKEPRYVKPSDAELRQRLSALEYAVTQQGATEPPFQNRYFDHHADGLYVDVVTGEPLFSSRDKFDSGTGWPSFTRPIEPNRVVTREDRSLGMARVEVISQAGASHLGHVFDDGPAPARKRYCINSAALRFVPVDRLAADGYGEYAPVFSGGGAVALAAEPTTCAAGCRATLETAVLAGGCFWGMQEILRKIPGVVETTVGYTGGTTPSPTYDAVHTGRTGHAEAVRVVFDPGQLSYADLLEKWFFRMHDPTTPGSQGNDVGSQYRSAIFVTSPEQRRVAEAVRARVNASGRWSALVVTEIVAAGPFTPAEAYHQDYLQQHPAGYTCHFLRD